MWNSRSNSKSAQGQTNWVIFTGVPCAGKTTIIRELAKLGHKTGEEVVRLYVEELQDSGVTSNNLESTLRGFDAHQTVLKRRIQREQSFEPDELVFFDRGVPDSLAYYALNKHNPDDAKKLINSHLEQFKYKQVFIFEALPIEEDGIRHETSEERKKLDKLFFDFYYQNGYTPTRVPIMTIEERLRFILKHLNLQLGASQSKNVSTFINNSFK